MPALTLVLLSVLPFLPVNAPQDDHAAYAADVATIDSTIAALYDVISGDAGDARDWNRFRHLFTPGARMTPLQATEDGQIAANAWSPEAYIARASGAFEQRGFHEQEIARRVERFGGLAHAWSTYETRQNAGDETPESRGINSIQLLYDGSRWWIMNISWQSEDEQHPLPEKYLKS